MDENKELDESGSVELVQSGDGLVWRVTGKHFVRKARKPYLLDVVGVESGLPNAFAPAEVRPIAPGKVE